jgi:hypothetical protein
MEKHDHIISFEEKLHFFRRKLAKIAEKCDTSIGHGLFTCKASVARLSRILCVAQSAQSPRSAYISSAEFRSTLASCNEFTDLGSALQFFNVFAEKLG